MNGACMRKIKIGHCAKFQDRDNFLPQVSRDFTPCFHFRCVARATFDRNLIHSAAACFLVMVCVGYSRVQLKTLSSLLDVRETCTVCPELFDNEMHDKYNGLLGCQQVQLNYILNNPKKVYTKHINISINTYTRWLNLWINAKLIIKEE